MATPKVPGDQKLYERVNCMLKLKVTKFQLPTPNGLELYLKKNSGGGQMYLPPVQNRVNRPARVNMAFHIHMTRAVIHTSFSAKFLSHFKLELRAGLQS